MATRKGPSVARLRTILKRQSDPSWGAEYVPSILATPAEAPSLSRASILTTDLVPGREIHVLSPAERALCLLGLYHPDTLGLQEQRMLSLEPSVHPLSNFPGFNSIGLPPLKGILDVAERLGYLEMIPLIEVPSEDDPATSERLPFPYIGDLLWAMRGGVRGVYCLDWNVKDTYKAFKLPPPRANGKPRKQQESRLAMARHEIQKTYHADARIRSIEIAGEGLDFHVAANLRQIFLHLQRPVGLSDGLRSEILERFRAALATSVPPLEVLTMYSESGACTLHQCRDLFHQFIWHRELRLDLFKPVLIDRPMRPEERDVIEVYADWFKE